jgi:cadmium resistance protein CadD (predicted permease)
MHSFPSLVGHVVHVSFHSSFVPNAIPWKKMMVNFGLLELQVGFKSCTRYFCKENEKESRKFFKHLLKIIGLYIELEKCNIQM